MCQKYVYCMPLYVRTDWCCAVYVIKLELSRIKYVKQNNPLRGEMGQDIHLGWYRGPSSTMVNNVRELRVSHKLMIKMQNKPQYNSMWRICLFVMLLISFWYFIIKSLFTAKSPGCLHGNNSSLTFQPIVKPCQIFIGTWPAEQVDLWHRTHNMIHECRVSWACVLCMFSALPCKVFCSAGEIVIKHVVWYNLGINYVQVFQSHFRCLCILKILRYSLQQPVTKGNKFGGFFGDCLRNTCTVFAVKQYLEAEVDYYFIVEGRNRIILSKHA